MPKDGCLVALHSHPVRLGNGLKMIGIDPDEQVLRELRIKVCKKAKKLYIAKQKMVLG
jgi:hypothetical protein